MSRFDGTIEISMKFSVMSKVCFLLAGIFFTGMWYFGMPTLNTTFAAVWFLIAITAFIAGIPGIFAAFEGYQMEKKHRYLLITAVSIVLGVISVSFILSAPMFHDNAYRDLLGKVEVSEFSQDISELKDNQARIVKQKMATILGLKQLGKDAGLGSRATLGTFHIQQVNGKLYWVAPLMHSTFFRWLNFKEEGTSGYVKVSATNPDDVTLVQELGGKKLHIKYQLDAYFNQDLERHLYFSGYMSSGLTDFTFEIDDAGKPYWVVTLYEKTVGFAGEDAKAVLVVDPETGSITKYSIADAPEWIDRIQPESFIRDQIDDWGEYVLGWWNSLFAKQDVLKVSNKELRLIYGDDGKSYWYSGITSSGNDKSNVGFLLVNTRTKEVKRYNVSGATEDSAESSAEGLVQQYKYDASNFILYNVGGIPTYIGPLTDAEGLVKGVAAVNMESYAIAGWGANVNDAIRSYRQALFSRGKSSNVAATSHEEAKGIVSRIASDIKNGNTSYYIVLENKEGFIFTADSNLSVEVPLTKIGDSVKIKYSLSGSAIVVAEDFDNLNVSLKSFQK